MTDHPNRQSTDELGFQAVIDEIPSRRRGQDASAIGGNGFTAKSDIGLAQTAFHLVLQAVKSAAAYKENMTGIDDLFLGFAATLKFQG